jgi:hypothetical protein
VPVAVCEARVVQVLPPRRCNETVPVNEAPLAVSWPVIEKDCLTWDEEGAEIVRAVGMLAGVALTVLRGLASITALALQNNNAHITSTTATTIQLLFSANISPHLDR